MLALRFIHQRFRTSQLRRLYTKYKDYTMIPENIFIENLLLIDRHKQKMGAYVECGVWRGGMSAAIAEVLNFNAEIHLFDSFEGLPEAKEIDGKAALAWQADKNAASYFDNCKAEEEYAIHAMKMAQATNFQIYKGWFNQTLPQYNGDKISILRLDGDWYESIMDSLRNLYPKVNQSGIIILDDYGTWDGCTRAAHDFLSETKSTSRILQWNNQIHYILKNDE